MADRNCPAATMRLTVIASVACMVAYGGYGDGRDGVRDPGNRARVADAFRGLPASACRLLTSALLVGPPGVEPGTNGL